MSSNGLKPLHIFLLTLAGCLLVIGLWYTFSYQAKQARMTELRTDIESAEAQAASYRQAQAALPELRQEIEGLEDERAEFIAALPQSTQMASVLTDMRRTAEETGIVVNGISVSSGDQNALPGGVRPVQLGLTMDGTYSEAYRALQRLETLNRFSMIDSLGLQMTEPTSEDPQLNGAMGVTVYTFDPSMASPAVDGGGSTPGAPAAPAPAAPAPIEGGEQ